MIILAVLILATLAFIWTESVKPVPESRAESQKIQKIITPVLELVVGKGNVTNHLVRKIAHFVEFGVFGLELALWTVQRKKAVLWQNLLWIPVGVLAACLDEGIQALVGRGNQLSDVMLDLWGFFTGAAVCFVICLLCIRKKKKTET